MEKVLIYRKPLTAVHYFRANKLLRLKYLVEFYRTTSAEITNNLTTLQVPSFSVLVIDIEAFLILSLGLGTLSLPDGG